MVALNQLACGEADRDARCRCMILYQMHDPVQAAVHCATVVFLVAEVLPRRLLLVSRDVKRMLHELVNTLVLGSGDWDDGDAQHPLHVVDTDAAAVAAELVHHVECQDDGDVQLHQLQCQVQVAFYVGGVGNVYYSFGVAVQDELAGDYLFGCVGGQGVDSRQVRDGSVRVAFDDSVFAVYRHAGEVAHVLVGACEYIEQGGLSAVLLAGKGE